MRTNCIPTEKHITITTTTITKHTHTHTHINNHTLIAMILPTVDDVYSAPPAPSHALCVGEECDRVLVEWF